MNRFIARMVVAAIPIVAVIVFGNLIADPGDKTACLPSPAGEAVPGSGGTSSAVEPGTARTLEEWCR